MGKSIVFLSVVLILLTGCSQTKPQETEIEENIQSMENTQNVEVEDKEIQEEIQEEIEEEVQEEVVQEDLQEEEEEGNGSYIYADALGMTMPNIIAQYGESNEQYDYNGGIYYEYEIDGYRLLFVTYAYEEVSESTVQQVVVFNPDIDYNGLSVGMNIEQLTALEEYQLTTIYNEWEECLSFSYSFGEDYIFVAEIYDQENIFDIQIMNRDTWENTWYASVG